MEWSGLWIYRRERQECIPAQLLFSQVQYAVSLFDWLIDWLIDRLVGYWLIDWLSSLPVESNGLSFHSVMIFRLVYDSGVIGSGICVLSKGQITAVLCHVYSLNGYAHKLQHGDWFGGKVAGLCKIFHKGLRINLYATHVSPLGPDFFSRFFPFHPHDFVGQIHAEYNRKSDEYLPHRIVQAYELSQFIRMTNAADDDVNIVAGDFNFEPDDLGYAIVLRFADLKDAWTTRLNVGGRRVPMFMNPPPPPLNERSALNRAHNWSLDSPFFIQLEEGESGDTCNTPDNVYSILENKTDTLPRGKRIDYIMYGNVKGEAFSFFLHNYVCIDIRRNIVPSHKLFLLHDKLLIDRLFPQLIDWLIDWWIDRLIDWSIYWLIDGLIDWLIDWFIDWLIDWLTDWSIDWLIDWLFDWLIWHVTGRTSISCTSSRPVLNRIPNSKLCFSDHKGVEALLQVGGPETGLLLPFFSIRKFNRTRTFPWNKHDKYKIKQCIEGYKDLTWITNRIATPGNFKKKKKKENQNFQK